MGQWNRLPDPFVTEELHSFVNSTRHRVLSIHPRSTLTRTLLPAGRFESIPPATRELPLFGMPRDIPDSLSFLSPFGIVPTGESCLGTPRGRTRDKRLFSSPFAIVPTFVRQARAYRRASAFNWVRETTTVKLLDRKPNNKFYFFFCFLEEIFFSFFVHFCFFFLGRCWLSGLTC